MALYWIDTEKIRLSYYTGKTNLRGFCVVYVRMIEGDRIIRISTGLRVKGIYWDNGKIDLHQCNRIDLKEHREKDIKLNRIIAEVEEVYLNSGKVGKHTLTKIIGDITGMKQKKKSAIKLTTLMEGVAMDNNNPKSQRVILSHVDKFKSFLTEKKIEDTPESLTTSTMRKYREWLLNQPITTRRAKDLFSYIFTFAGKIERKHGISFDELNKNKIEPIEINLTQTERLRGIALTREEIKKIEGLNLSGNMERYRDYFLLQCYTGVRREDITLLLDENNFREVKENPYVIFNNQKTGTEVIIPLSGLFGDITPLWKKWKGGKLEDKQFPTYNLNIKEIAKRAGLNREIKKTEERKGVKSVITKPLFELISSHSGRHTFITNCQRDLNLSPAQIRKITGHSTTEIIEKTYTNTTTEDNINLLENVLKSNPIPENKFTSSVNGNPEEIGLEGIIREVCKLIGLEVKGEISVIDTLNRINRRKGEIMERYGKSMYEKIKSLLTIGKNPNDIERIKLIFCKAFNRRIKVKI